MNGKTVYALNPSDDGAGIKNDTISQKDVALDDRGSIVYLQGVHFLMLAAL